MRIEIEEIFIDSTGNKEKTLRQFNKNNFDDDEETVEYRRRRRSRRFLA